MDKVNLWKGDCLDLMNNIADKSVDLVLTDPPYGTTACKWDSIIPFKPMWEQLNRVIKDNGAIVLFGSEPFSSMLRCSNLKMYKYDWIWEKSKATGYLNAKKQPLRKNENICVFYKKQCIYNAQGLVKKDVPTINKGNRGLKGNGNSGECYGYAGKDAIQEYENYPLNIIKFNVEVKPIHPTQKPVALLEYLIKTYTLENETVLDFTMGSGSTGVACKHLNRNFIGIELDDKYFEIAKDRIENE